MPDPIDEHKLIGEDVPAMQKGYSLKQVVAMLKKHQGNATQRELAERIGISQTYLSDVLNERGLPGKAILDYLDLEQGFIPKSESAA